VKGVPNAHSPAYDAKLPLLGPELKAARARFEGLFLEVWLPQGG